jgi:hypothetical protein
VVEPYAGSVKLLFCYQWEHCHKGAF